jgi:hypothetical protein
LPVVRQSSVTAAYRASTPDLTWPAIDNCGYNTVYGVVGFVWVDEAEAIHSNPDKINIAAVLRAACHS